MAMLAFAVALTIGVTSCESEYSKESNALIQKYEVALSEQNLQESRKLSNALENRELNSTQMAKVRSLNQNLSEWELQVKKQEIQRKYEEAMRKANEAEKWLVNSVKDFEQLLKKQKDAPTLEEYVEFEKQIVAMQNKKDAKIRERERYLEEAENYKRQMNE
jgi:hypothetical protein